MTRTYDNNGYRIIPATEHRQGATAIRIDDHRELVICTTGPEAEATLRAAMLARVA